MLFSSDLHERIRNGEVTVAFRNWKRPTVSAGGTLRTPVGVLRIEEIVPIAASEITEADAVAAGFDTVPDVLRSLRPGQDRASIAFDFAASLKA